MSGPRRDLAIYMPAAKTFYTEKGSIGGGAELQTTLLARGLVERGINVAHVIWPSENLRARRPGEPELVVRAPHDGRRPAGYMTEAVNIWRSLARADADAYLFRGSGPQVAIGAAFARRRGRKVIFAAANDLDFEFEFELGRLQASAFRAALRRVDAIVLQTPDQLQLARERVPDGPRLELIPSFVEPAEPAGTPRHFLWVGRVVDYKRPLELVRVASMLPELEFTMVAMTNTESPPGMQEELEARAAEVPNLKLRQRMERERLLELVADAHAMVSTSTYEGMPNVFLEAWARGVPVASLSFNPDGVISRERLGVVADDSLERLAEDIKRLHSDRELRDRLGANGRDYVFSHHDRASVGDRWATLLAEVLGGEGSLPRSAEEDRVA